jgi:signal transduction histidine kinase
MRVLAIDDDAVVRMSMRGMVTGLGHECLLADSGVQAWQTLQHERVDVVITDRRMPDLDGLELCRRIRNATSASEYVYIVIASGLGRDDQALDGMVAGADDYLVKPLRRAQLERKLISGERVTTLHRQLAETSTKLIAANRLQADMLAMLGHDARQPLTAVLGYNEANLDTWEISPIQVKRELVVKADRAARHLHELIEDVLTMANLDSGNFTCRPAALEVDAAIKELVGADPDENPVSIGGDPFLQVWVDRWHFQQIVTNLLGNAKKYGAPPIVVTVRQNNDRVEIDVSDGGEGVPGDFVPHLFERFTRAETGVATLKSGTGFGLYIVQSLAQANGGHVSYRRGPEQGSCFTLSLPSPSGSPAAGPTGAAASSSDSPG